MDDSGFYFTNSKDIEKIIFNEMRYDFNKNRVECIEIIKANYSWDKIISQHINLFKKLIQIKK